MSVTAGGSRRGDTDGMDDLAALSTAVAALREKEALQLVRAAVEAGHDSMTILRAVKDGMQAVGERYEHEEIFLSGLIMAGEIFRGAVELAPPVASDQAEESDSGRLLIGTVAGDIHDIGKNVTALTFRSFGFTVKDIGVNVPAETFLEEALSFRPDIIGLSGLLSVAFTSMRETVALLRAHAGGLHPAPVIILGGATLDEQVARYVGADLWTTDAMHGVRLCQDVLQTRR